MGLQPPTESLSPESLPLEWTVFQRARDLHDLELLYAHFAQHRFQPHSHEEYVLAVVEAGAEAFCCDGQVFTALPGQVMLFHPNQVHTGAAGGPQGWTYRALYLPTGVFESQALPEFAGPLLEDAVLSQQLLNTHAVLSGVASSLERSSKLAMPGV